MSGSESTRDRRARRRGPGWVSALLGAGLLIVLGFGLGVIAGLIMEETDLILDYAAGRTESVAVEVSAVPAAPGGVVAATPDVAARPAPGGGITEAPHDPDPPAARTSVDGVPAFEDGGADSVPGNVEARPGAASDTPAAGFAVQVGAFAEASAAEHLARRLRERGLPVYVAPSASGDAGRWRVRVGPLATRAEAEGLAGRLEREEQLATWVLTESPL